MSTRNNADFTYWNAACNYSESTIPVRDRIYSINVIPSEHENMFNKLLFVYFQYPNHKVQRLSDLSLEEAFMYLLFFHWMETSE